MKKLTPDEIKSLIAADMAAMRKRPRPETGDIYFLASATHIKIGFSAAGIKKRVRSIRQNHYEKLELLKVFADVPYGREKELHKRFAEFKVKGEWFRRVPEIEDFIRYHYR